MDKMKAVVFRAVRDLQIEEVPKPRMKRNTISHGTVGGAMTGNLRTIRSRASGTTSSNGTEAPMKSGVNFERMKAAARRPAAP